MKFNVTVFPSNELSKTAYRSWVSGADSHPEHCSYFLSHISPHVIALPRRVADHISPLCHTLLRELD